MKRLIVCFVLCYIIAGFCGCTYQKDGFMSLEYVPALQLHYKTDANLSYGRISATSDGVIYYFDNSQSAILQMSSDGTKRVLCQANDIRRMQVIGDNLYLLEFESMRENDYGCFPNYVLYRYSIKDGKKTSIFFEESRFASYLADVKAEKRSNALYDFYIDNDNYVYLAWLHWSPKLETPDIRLEILNTEGKLNGSDITLIRPAKRLLSNKDELLSVGRINNIYIVTDFISDYSSVALVSATLTDGENNQIVMHFDQEIYYPHSTNITENATIVECIAGKKIVFLGNRIIVFCQNFQEENSVCQLAKERSIVRMIKINDQSFYVLTVDYDGNNSVYCWESETNIVRPIYRCSKEEKILWLDQRHLITATNNEILVHSSEESFSILTTYRTDYSVLDTDTACEVTGSWLFVQYKDVRGNTQFQMYSLE